MARTKRPGRGLPGAWPQPTRPGPRPPPREATRSKPAAFIGRAMCRTADERAMSPREFASAELLFGFLQPALGGVAPFVARGLLRLELRLASGKGDQDGRDRPAPRERPSARRTAACAPESARPHAGLLDWDRATCGRFACAPAPRHIRRAGSSRRPTAGAPSARRPCPPNWAWRRPLQARSAIRARQPAGRSRRRSSCRI